MGVEIEQQEFSGTGEYPVFYMIDTSNFFFHSYLTLFRGPLAYMPTLIRPLVVDGGHDTSYPIPSISEFLLDIG